MEKYPSVGSSGPYRDPGIGGTTCTLYHGVSAAHGLHSVVDASWKFVKAFTQPSSIIEQGFVVTGLLYYGLQAVLFVLSHSFFYRQ